MEFITYVEVKHMSKIALRWTEGDVKYTFVSFLYMKWYNICLKLDCNELKIDTINSKPWF